jgi:hypothetical protein
MKMFKKKKKVFIGKIGFFPQKMFQVFFCNGHTDKANVRKTKTKIKFS